MWFHKRCMVYVTRPETLKQNYNLDIQVMYGNCDMDIYPNMLILWWCICLTKTSLMCVLCNMLNYIHTIVLLYNRNLNFFSHVFMWLSTDIFECYPHIIWNPFCIILIYWFTRVIYSNYNCTMYVYLSKETVMQTWPTVIYYYTFLQDVLITTWCWWCIMYDLSTCTVDLI